MEGEMETATVEMSIYEWHMLLREIEFLLQIGNRDDTHAKALYEKIAGQLHGATVVVGPGGEAPDE